MIIINDDDDDGVVVMLVKCEYSQILIMKYNNLINNDKRKKYFPLKSDFKQLYNYIYKTNLRSIHKKVANILLACRNSAQMF